MGQSTFFPILSSIFAIVSCGNDFFDEQKTSDYKVPLTELCSFNYLQWKELPENSLYVPTACVPRAIEKVGNRMFITTPRCTGVPVTLSVFDIDEIVDNKCPQLSAYPSVEANKIYVGSNNIINVQGFAVDQCAKGQRLWLFDTGVMETRYGPTVIEEPAIIVIDTNCNQIVRRKELPTRFYSVKTVQGFTNVVVNTAMDCSNTYAYIVNSLDGTLTVYSYKDDTFWQFYSTLFNMNAYPDSLFQVKTLNGTNVHYQLDANLWHLTVDYVSQKLIFSARSSKHLFTIPLKIVHNQRASLNARELYDIKYLGKLNARGQSSAFELLPGFKTVFGIQEQNYGIFCWNYRKFLSDNEVKLVAGDPELLPFLVDMIVDGSDGSEDQELIVLSNNKAGIVADDFYMGVENFRIFTVSVREILEEYPECGAPCFDLASNDN
ncbi:L-dopachrome tautomerase yellow-f2-like [Culicoides brevitarsis]|uniref:L-dopachrome tautomerase yellow-f2-like n=1 Tax=Culicoides brevitarsis TaxID=469753 RepID=UPI00307B840E